MGGPGLLAAVAAVVLLLSILQQDDENAHEHGDEVCAVACQQIRTSSVHTLITVQGNAEKGQRTYEQLQCMTNEVVVTARRLLNDHLGVCGHASNHHDSFS